MNPQIGNFAWMQSKQGQLTFKEKLKVIQKVMLPSTLNFLKTQLKVGDQALHNLAMSEIILPDTTLIKEAIAVLEEKADPAIIHHSWRTYFWGAALGKIHQKSFDAEVLLASALCHDLGLTDNDQKHGQDCQCFTFKSALAFEEIATTAGFPQHKTNLVKDAICLHMNGFIDETQPSEVVLLQYGAACDVIGEQFYRLNPQYRAQVLAKYPREGFNQKFKALIKQESQQVKNSRTALLNHLGLSMMISMNPFEE